MTRPPPPSFVRLLNMLNAIRQMSPFDNLNGEEVLLLDLGDDDVFVFFLGHVIR